MSDARGLSWVAIVRLGLVQTALGAIVVLTTSTINRIMVVELALPAMLPGALVAWHYAIQVLRPRLGHGSDVGGRRTPWIVVGMAVLAAGGILAAVATAELGHDRLLGLVLAVFAYALIGAGVGAAGTSLLVLLAQRVDPARRAAASAIVWIMMIVGFIVTSGTVGAVLDPFSPERLVVCASVVGVVAWLVAVAAVFGIEGRASAVRVREQEDTGTFREALVQVWREPRVRRFATFVFISMLAYSAQDLILEPFAGIVFGMTPGETTRLAGVQNSGVLCGMLLVAILGRRERASLGPWTFVGCIGSALGLLALAGAAFVGPGWPLKATLFALGVANGVFAIAAIAAMMGLVGEGRASREGVRMGLWGAAQALAFGGGGFLGTMFVDIANWLIGTPFVAYASVFVCEAVLFLFAAKLALRVAATRPAAQPVTQSGFALRVMSERR